MIESCKLSLNVKTYVSEKKAKLLVNILLNHPLGATDQELLQRVVRTLHQRGRFHGKLQTLANLSTAAQTN